MRARQRTTTPPPIGFGPSGVISTRRVLLLLFALLVMLAAVAGRTIYLQSAKGRMLSQYADGQQQNTQTLPAVRGDILDRNGRQFALGEDAITFYATPKLLENRAGTALQVAEILGLSRMQAEELSTRLIEAEGGFVYVARQISRGKAKLLQDAAIPGIAWYDEEKRLYPGGAVAGQVIGRVDPDGKGLEGIEMLYDNSLTGVPGKQVAVNDPNGVPIDVLELQRERDGRDVQLTLDYSIQEEAERQLLKTKRQMGAKSATAIVMNPRTGEILAMANVPRVNPANWGKAPPTARKNRAITDTYEPGSTFKIVSISAALEEGLTTPNSSMYVPAKLKFCDDKDTCTVGESHPRPAGNMTTRQILVESSNVGTIKLAQKVRNDALAKGKGGNAAVDSWIRRFGFGALTGIDFPGESGGIMHDVKDWSDVSIGNIPIGQGISVTPIQLVSAYAAVANDGVLIQPHLLKRIGNEPEAKHASRRVLTEKTAAMMRNMFAGVVANDRGTGRKAGIDGYEVAGKTGTANVAGPGGYIKGKYIASFVGFVPAKNPKLVTLVVVNEPTNGYYGGDVAAPAFEEITEFALTTLAIPPDGNT